LHPAVAAAHNQSGLEYILRSEDRVEAWFEAITQGQPSKKHCDQMYRVKIGGYGEVQEYLTWHQTTTSNDEYGNVRTFSTVIGKYELPLFEYQFDTLSKQRKATGISSFEETYDIPFTVAKLEELEKEGMIDGKTKFCVKDASTTYSVSSFQDFKNTTHEDLLYSSRTGLRPNQTYEQVPRPVAGAKSK
jgi:hypothetical protein